MEQKKRFKKNVFALLLCMAGVASAENGVVAYWSFDQFSGDTSFESTGNGAHVVTEGLSLADGVSGSAIELNGDTIDTYIMNSDSMLNVPEFTIEGWFYSYEGLVKAGGFDSYVKIFDYTQVGPSGSNISQGYAVLITAAGKLELWLGKTEEVGDWIWITSEEVISANRWYHFAASYDGDFMRLYLDGKYSDSLEYAGGYEVPFKNGRIGSQVRLDSTIRDLFVGKLDELKVFDHALSADTIAAHYESLKPEQGAHDSTKRVIAYWPFEESSGDTTYEATGNGFHVVSTDLQFADGVSGRALECISQGFETTMLGSDSMFNFPEFSVEGWFYSYVDMVEPGSFYNYKQVFDFARIAPGISEGYSIAVTSEATLAFGVARTDGLDHWATAVTNTLLKPNRWYHFAATYDGVEVRLYLNGELNDKLEYTGGYELCGEPARIGYQYMADGTLRNWFNGRLDELKLYNYALSIDTVFQHYHSLKPEEEVPFEINFGMKTVYAEAGEEIWMPIYVTNYEEYEISACQFALSYDGSVLQLEEVFTDSGLVHDWMVTYNDEEGAYVRFAMAGEQTPITYGEGELLRCKFRVRNDPGNQAFSDINLSSIVIDETNNLIMATTTPGKIVVDDAEVLYGDVNGNEEVNVFDAQKILQYVVGLYDLPDPSVPNFSTMVADVSGNGSVTSYDAALVFQHSVGLLPEFPVQQNKNLGLSKKRTMEVPVAHLTIQKSKSTDESVVYELRGSNLKGFVAGEFALALENMENVTFGNADTEIDGATLKTRFDAESGRLLIALTTNDDIDDRGELSLFWVELPAVYDSPSSVSLAKVMLNEGQIATNYSSQGLRENVTSIENEIKILETTMRRMPNGLVIQNATKKPGSVVLYNAAGRMISRKNYSASMDRIFINTSRYSAGIYFCRVKTEVTAKTYRIFIK